MSLIMTATVFFAGCLVGPILMFALGPALPKSLRTDLSEFFVKSGIRMGGRWILELRRSGEYDLHATEYDDEKKVDAVDLDDEDDERVWEDPKGAMSRLFGKPFGIAYEDSTAVVDPITAKMGEEYGKKVADGGIISPDEEFTIEQLRDRAVVGRMQNANRLIEFVNPFTTIPSGRQLVDIRGAVNVLKSSGTPETPRRAADDARRAAEAHKAFGSLKQQVGLLAAFMAGAIACYIGVSAGGGGGGGGSVSVGLMIETMARPMLLGWV
ncbi:hypothetical protein [Halomarina rubra]|uniref:Uncharacterized protein n=1 Tax=Halomarina rubra TaxID=2071873 RepID=A0ABD6B0I4_9EURY|nr:hypothetical protein [Halomarina rubra]